MTGIYKISSNIKPECIYVGSAVNIKHRWSKHSYQLKNGKHHNIILQSHYNKYGESDLQFSVLLKCDKEDLIKNEQIYIDKLNPYFNICRTAGSSLGVKYSDESKVKMSESATGKLKSAEVKAKMSAAAKGRVCSTETKVKMSLAAKGRIHSVESRAKMSRAAQNMSDEHRAKLSKAQKGKTHSDETRAKMSLSSRWRKK